MAVKLSEEQKLRRTEQTKEYHRKRREKAKKFGMWVNNHIAKKNMTQKDLASATGIEEKLISRYIGGHKWPDQEKLLLIIEHTIECEDKTNCPIMHIKETIN